MKITLTRKRNIMKKTMFVLCMAIAAMIFTTVSGYALPRSCAMPNYTVLPYGSGANPGNTTLKIAVAEIFYVPLLDFLTNYYFPQAPAGTTITVCSNTTVVLMNDIISNPGIYDFFFAADTSAAGLGLGSFTYAWGIPIFFGYTSGATNLIANVGDLMNGLNNPTALSDTVSVAGIALANYSINATNANMVAVAGNINAPPGQVANAIMGALGTSNPGVQTIQFNTVINVQDLVGTDVTVTMPPAPPTVHSIYSGFAKKAQFCSGIGVITAPIAYVEFTNSVYALNQTAIQLTSNSDDLYLYIQGQIANGGWSAFISGYCY
jgi:hypothetical protein